MCSKSIGHKIHLPIFHDLAQRSERSKQARQDPPRRRRLKVWEVRDHMECSIIGTCMSDSDLQKTLKRCRLNIAKGATGYELHGYFTQQIKTENTVSRAVQKLLDRRHEGIVRAVGRLEGSELVDLWQEEFTAGRIPGAYWAFQTHRHIPDELHAQIFGEVHMLSHVLGRTVHATAARASEFQTRIADLESRIERQRKRHATMLRERDTRIDHLQAMVQQTPLSRMNDAPDQPRDGGRPLVQTSKHQRALIAARERARQSEARATALEAEVRRYKREFASQARGAATPTDANACPGAIACRLSLPEGEQLKVLYIGGRSGSINKLRDIAKSASAEFHHHDGGLQQAFGRIDDLISQCHVVFCPVDCVSHRACIYAKDRCRRREKTFIPLRSAGGSTFARALEQVGVEQRET